MSNFERYKRNIILSQVSEAGQKKLARSKVLICGAGGLGSGVIANLSALGVGYLGIVDNDKVELSNLNRQFIHKFSNIGKNKTESAKEWISEFNPDIDTKLYSLRLDESNYKDVVESFDIIVDCFDSYKSKFLLNDIAIDTGKILVHGGVGGFGGQVSVVEPFKTPCLRCVFSDVDYDSEIEKGIVSPVVSVIASIQAMEVLKIILSEGETLKGKLLVYDALRSSFRTIALCKNSQCLVCSV